MNDENYAQGGSSSTEAVFGLYSEPVVSTVIVKAQKSVPVRPVVSKAVINAVYSHIKAVRTLGRQSINTMEIAQALGLDQAEVMHAVRALKAKGVKVAGK